MFPQIEGNLSFQASSSEFVKAFYRRVENGLLTGQPGPRSNYQVTESGPGRLRVRAGDWWTAINVGLNDLDLSLLKNGILHYHLRYWRWAIYCLGLCGVLGIVGVIFFLSLDIRSYITNNVNARIPGLSIEQNVYFAWGNLVFWGFVWPWILIALHKRPLRRLVARLVNEIDAQAINAKSNSE